MSPLQQVRVKVNHECVSEDGRSVVVCIPNKADTVNSN